MDDEATASIRCLFFCRGRGRGHAIPDLEIVKHLRGMVGDDVSIQFASYSAGAETLAAAGETVFDLGLPDLNPFVETLVVCARLIGTIQPDLVVSHEEFAALPAAKIFDIPTVFLTDWFVDDPDRPIMRSLLFADEIVFLERDGLFAPPRSVRDKVRYVGPIVRAMAYTREDRERARKELGLPADAGVVGVVPGAWATEDRAPLWDLLVGAFDALELPRKRLVWIAGRDADELRARAAGRGDVTVLQSCEPVERLMAACDLGVTKANRGATLDFHYLGVPSVSISRGANPVDDRIVSLVETNTALFAEELDTIRLADELKKALDREPGPLRTSPSPDATDAAAQRILHYLTPLRAGTG